MVFISCSGPGVFIGFFLWFLRFSERFHSVPKGLSPGFLMVFSRVLGRHSGCGLGLYRDLWPGTNRSGYGVRLQLLLSKLGFKSSKAVRSEAGFFRF